MAATYKPAFFRPIESTYDSTVASIGGEDIALEKGTFANVLSLCRSLCIACRNDTSYDLSCKLTDDGFLSLKLDSGTGTLSFSYSTLSGLLGFNSSVSLSTSWTDAGYIPGSLCAGSVWSNQGPYTWYPSFNSGDQGGWTSNPDQRVVGNLSRNGLWCGMSSGSTIWYRRLMFPQELATNGVSQAQTTSIEYSLEEFMTRSLEAQTTDDESVQNTGFWFYRDMNDAISDAAYSGSGDDPWSASFDVGIKIDYASSPDTKVFCETSPGELPRDWFENPSLPATYLRHNQSISIHSADNRSWKYLTLD